MITSFITAATTFTATNANTINTITAVATTICIITTWEERERESQHVEQ